MKEQSKRILSFILSLVVILVTVVNPLLVEAADTIVEHYDNISSYRNGTEYTYPQKSGYVFAGWYEDETLKKPLSTTDKSEGAYAKFVIQDVLSVKCQLKVGTTVASASTDLRILTTVDNLQYKEVGFVFSINGKSVTRTTNVVYETITGFKDGEGIVYQPSVFSKASNYFMAYELLGIYQDFFGTDIQVTPIWTTLDGTTVSGVSKAVNINKVIADGAPTYITYGQVWSAPSTVKIKQDNTSYSPKGAPELAFQAVRDEYENAQLIITAEKDITHFELKASDLTNGSHVLSAENVEIYVEKYIPYDDHNGNGIMPDALIPMDVAVAYGENTITEGKNGALWVTVYVPQDTPAGTYEGSFLLVMDGAEGRGKVNIPVSVTVYDYSLPQERSAKTLFSWRYDYTAVGELNGSIKMMEHYYEFYQKYGISMQSLPMETLSGYETKEALKTYYDQLSTYSILSRVGDISTDLLYNEAAIREQILAIAELSAEQERNLFDKAMIYYQDEPNFEDAAIRVNVLRNLKTLRAILERCVHTIDVDSNGTYGAFKALFSTQQEWKNAILDIPNIIPFYTEDWLLENENTEEGQEFLTYLNCICPNFIKATDSQMEKLSALCAKYDIDIWWYGMDEPTAPAPTFHLGDSNLLSARTVSWIQSKHNIKGNLYWDTAGYVIDEGEFTNVYEHPYRSSVYDWAAGDGILSYPGAAYGVYGALPSMRLMSIRDGLEEYEILEEVKAKVKTGFGTSNAAESAVSQFCDDVLYDDITDMYADGEDDLNFTSLRKQLIELACALEEGLGFVLGSTTSSGIFDLTKTITYYAQEGATVTINGSTQSATSNCTYQYKYNSWTSSIDNVQVVVKNGTNKTATYSLKMNSSSSSGNVSGNTTLEVIKDSAAGSGGSSVVPEEPDTTVEPGAELIFSFESYQDITGTALKVGNQIGETSINKEEQYITQGAASWLIKPQGDYGKADSYPYFRMKCLDTTFIKSDFNEYDKVMMDVYNASDEAVQIEWNFVVINFVGTDEATEKIVCTLAPNAWTTCEYDLTGEAYGQNLRLNQVKYMTVTFLTKKDSKTDTVPELYLDNLRGHFADEDRVITDITFDFDAGITFEEQWEHYLFTTPSSVNNYMELSRVAYEDTTIGTRNASFGEYGLKGNAGNALWPSFNLSFGKTYSKGQILTFLVYVEANSAAASGKTYRLGASDVQGGSNHVLHTTTGQFNTWMPVYIELVKDVNVSYFHVNFDDDYGNNILGEDANVQVYFDNFHIWDSMEEAKTPIEDNGTVTIYNPNNTDIKEYTFDVVGEAGQTLSFDLDFTPAKSMTLYVLENGEWGEGVEHRYDLENWSRNRTFEVQLLNDIQSVKLWVQITDASVPFINNVITISNVHVVQDKDVIKIGGDGNYTFVQRFDIPAKAGQSLSFDIELLNGATKTYTMRIMENGDWSDTLHVTGGNTATRKTVSITFTKDVEFFNLWLQYEDHTPDSNMWFKVRNVDVYTKISGNAYTFSHPITMSGKAGQTLSFDIELFNSNTTYTMRIMENGEWSDTLHVTTGNTAAKQTVSVTLTKDITYFNLWLQYADETPDANRVFVVRNIKIETPTSATIGYSEITTATFPISVVQGQAISFDVEKKSSGSYTLYVLENGGWGEYEHYLGSLSATKQTIHVLAKHDITNFVIWIQVTGGAYDGIEITNVQVQ